MLKTITVVFTISGRPFIFPGEGVTLPAGLSNLGSGDHTFGTVFDVLRRNGWGMRQVYSTPNNRVVQHYVLPESSD